MLIQATCSLIADPNQELACLRYLITLDQRSWHVLKKTDFLSNLPNFFHASRYSHISPSCIRIKS